MRSGPPRRGGARGGGLGSSLNLLRAGAVILLMVLTAMQVFGFWRMVGRRRAMELREGADTEGVPPLFPPPPTKAASKKPRRKRDFMDLADFDPLAQHASSFEEVVAKAEGRKDTPAGRPAKEREHRADPLNARVVTPILPSNAACRVKASGKENGEIYQRGEVEALDEALDDIISEFKDPTVAAARGGASSQGDRGAGNPRPKTDAARMRGGGVPKRRPPSPPPSPMPPYQERIGEAALAIINPPKQTTKGSGVDGCSDLEDLCPSWSAGGECKGNPGFMLKSCMLSCGLCMPMELAQVGAAIKWSIKLSHGVAIPSIGFGTAGLGHQTKQAVRWALEVGYRLIDSAQAREWYREDLVGEAIKESGIPRNQLYITSKLHPRDLGYEPTIKMVDSSCRDLHTSHLDLFLLHYPACWGTLCMGKTPMGTWEDSWRAMEDLLERGKVRAIGVSNFDITQFAALLQFAKVKPHVIQRNSDVFSNDRAMQQFAKQNGVLYQGYSTLGSQWTMQGYKKNPVLASPVVGEVARKLGKSPAQVVLRYALYQGQSVIPRSSRKLRMAENLALDFDLDKDDMRMLESLDGKRPPRNR